MSQCVSVAAPRVFMSWLCRAVLCLLLLPLVLIESAFAADCCHGLLSLATTGSDMANFTKSSTTFDMKWLWSFSTITKECGARAFERVCVGHCVGAGSRSGRKTWKFIPMKRTSPYQRSQRARDLRSGDKDVRRA